MVGGDSATWGPDYYSGGSSYYTYSTSDYYGGYPMTDYYSDVNSYYTYSSMSYGPDYYSGGYTTDYYSTTNDYYSGGVVYGGDSSTYGPSYYDYYGGGYDYYSDGGYVSGVTSYSYTTDYYSGGYVSGVSSYSSDYYSGGMTGGGVYSNGGGGSHDHTYLDAKPECNIEGYDCDCEPINPIDPFSRKPVPTNDNYVWYDRDVETWLNYISGLGWTTAGGWNVIPDSYFGYWIFLDQWSVFGYEPWEQWRFGITIRNYYTGSYVDWDIVGGVEYVDESNDYIYSYVFKVPDQPEVAVGDCFVPVYFDATEHNGVYIPGDTDSYDAPMFCIGQPYHDQSEEENEMGYIKAIFEMADEDGDGCGTYNEMVALFEWGTKDADVYLQMVNDFFDADMNADGLMTWSELNKWLSVEGSNLG